MNEKKFDLANINFFFSLHKKFEYYERFSMKWNLFLNIIFYFLFIWRKKKKKRKVR